MNALDVLCAQLARDLFAIAEFLFNYSSISYHFRDKARYWSTVAIFSYLPCIRRPVKGVPIGVLPCRLVQKKYTVFQKSM